MLLVVVTSTEWTPQTVSIKTCPPCPNNSTSTSTSPVTTKTSHSKPFGCWSKTTHHPQPHKKSPPSHHCHHHCRGHFFYYLVILGIYITTRSSPNMWELVAHCWGYDSKCHENDFSHHIQKTKNHCQNHTKIAAVVIIVTFSIKQLTISWVYILPQNHPQTCGIDFRHHIVVTLDLQPQYYTIASSSKVFYLQFIQIL